MIRPKLTKKIQYIGRVGGAQKQKLISQASCVLFPSVWNEPFGLVMVEALACGTPVLALKNGAAPEILKGMPQLLCKDANEMANKVINLAKLPNSYKCRQYVKTHFSDIVLAKRYIMLYKKIIQRHKSEDLKF